MVRPDSTPGRLLRLAALAGFLLLACTEGEGPFDLGGGPHLAHLSVVASVDGPAPTPAALQPATMQATVSEPESMAVVEDTTFGVAPGEEVDLAITVQIDAPEKPFLLELVLRNDRGAEIYRSERSTVIARVPGVGGGGAPARITLSYSGPGAGSTRLEVTPDELSLRFGESTALEATAFGEDGSSLGSVPVDWTTPDPDLLTLQDAEAGRWQAREARGLARVVASFEPTGLVDTALVRVKPLPGDLAIHSGNGQDGSAGSPLDAPVVVRVEGTDGLPLEDEEVLFEALAEGSVAPASRRTDSEGLAAAEWTLGPTLGEQALTATVAEAPSLSLTFTAQAGPAALARIVVTPEAVAFDALTASRELEAAGFDVFDNPFPLAEVAWTSSTPSVATVSSSGVVTAVGNGTAEVTASSEGVTSAAVEVVVEQVPVEAAISPASGWEVAVGALLGFGATARDRLGQAVAGMAFSWSSSNPGVLSIESGGVATGVAPGSATVTATLADDPSISASSSGAVVEPPPMAPSGVTATPVFPGEGSFTGFEVEWTDRSSDEDRFWVERSLTGGSSWQTVDASVPKNTDSLYDGGPEVWPTDTQVFHRVRACAESRCSAPAVTPFPSVTSPELPADVSAAWLAVQTTLRVSWTDTNTYETGYRVRLRERTCSGTISVDTFTVGPDVTSIDIPDLTANGDYDIYVRSTNDTEWSGEVFHSIGIGPLCGDS